jgi:hypothetical protein
MWCQTLQAEVPQTSEPRFATKDTPDQPKYGSASLEKCLGINANRGGFDL